MLNLWMTSDALSSQHLRPRSRGWCAHPIGVRKRSSEVVLTLLLGPKYPQLSRCLFNVYLHVYLTCKCYIKHLYTNEISVNKCWFWCIDVLSSWWIFFLYWVYIVLPYLFCFILVWILFFSHVKIATTLFVSWVCLLGIPFPFFTLGWYLSLMMRCVSWMQQKDESCFPVNSVNLCLL